MEQPVAGCTVVIEACECGVGGPRGRECISQVIFSLCVSVCKEPIGRSVFVVCIRQSDGSYSLVLAAKL